MQWVQSINGKIILANSEILIKIWVCVQPDMETWLDPGDQQYQLL